MGKPADFRHLGDAPKFEGHHISVVEASFAAPDGSVFRRDVVRHPGAVAVVPVTDRATVLLVRQYRGAVDRHLLEIPAGTCDVSGERPEETARRELQEEAGARAGRIQLVAEIFNTPGFCDERSLIYLATDLQPCDSSRKGEEEEHMEVVEVPLADIDEMVGDGRLVDGQTILGLLVARQYLDAASPALRDIGQAGP